MTTPDIHGDQSAPPDRGLQGFQVLAWGLLCTFVWLAIVAVATFIVDAIDGGEASSEIGLLVFVIGQGIAGLVGWLILPWLIMHRRRTPHLIAWQRPTGADALWAAGGLLSIYAVLFVYGAIVTAIGADSLIPQSTIDDDRLFTHTSVIIVLGILVILCAPLYEEAFARGFVLGGLRPHWGTISAFIISASVFSALHADLGSLIPFAIAGVVLGVLYLRSQSLTAPCLAHLAFNVIGFSATLIQQLG